VYLATFTATARRSRCTARYAYILDHTFGPPPNPGAPLLPLLSVHTQFGHPHCHRTVFIALDVLADGASLRSRRLACELQHGAILQLLQPQ
jgi:hypothetical protein